jgi:hypothetical protein
MNQIIRELKRQSAGEKLAPQRLRRCSARTTSTGTWMGTSSPTRPRGFRSARGPGTVRFARSRWKWADDPRAGHRRTRRSGPLSCRRDASYLRLARRDVAAEFGKFQRVAQHAARQCDLSLGRIRGH